MPDEIKKDVQVALSDSADLLHYTALVHVPVEHGDLAGSLHKARSGDGLSWKVGYWRKGNLRNWLRAGWRAKFIEFGTRESPAQPFLGPALRVCRAWMIRRITKAVDKALRRAASG